jgi:uncharacterized protein YdiU (UPF0061 family)
MRRKFGLSDGNERDMTLAGYFLQRMTANKADYTLTFRLLCRSCIGGPDADGPVRSLFENPASFDEWAATWRERLAQETVSPEERASSMRSVNPAFIPRNHRIEAVIAAAVANSDYSLFEELLKVLDAPYDDQPEFAHYARPPAPEEIVQQTFCGT